MGALILVLAVAAAGFLVGRFSTRRPAGGDDGPQAGLPHPAQIFEEGYQAGLRDALADRADTPGAGTGYTLVQGARTGHQTVPHYAGPPSPAAAAAVPPVPAVAVPPVPAAAVPHVPAVAVPPVPAAAVPPSPGQALVPGAPAPGTPAGPAPQPPVVPAGPAAGIPVDPGALHRPAVRGGVTGTGFARSGGHGPASAHRSRPAQPRSEAELAAEKRRRDLRNINITLYSASLLLVAAAALFIGISIPEQARFAGIVLLTVLFYASGLVIHARRKNLQPAAVAFTGTGLALIPVVGLALHNFLLHDAALAWTVTSLVGTAAFAYAAARLESRVITYLALTFLLSSALASGAAVRSGILWYFVFTVLLATLVSLAAVRRPVWLNNLYLDAFVASHRYLVPATAAAALLTFRELGGGALTLIFLAIAAYYAVLMWQGPVRQALAHSYGVRAGATAGLVSLTHLVSDSVPHTLLAAVFVLGAQAVVLTRSEARYAAAEVQAGYRTARAAVAGTGNPGAESAEQAAGGIYVADAWIVTSLQFLAGLAAALAYGFGIRAGDANVAAYAASAVLVLVGLCSAAWKFAGPAEAAVAAALVPGILPRLLEARASLWPMVLVLVLVTAYLVLRAVRTSGNGRAGFILAARSTGILLVPFAVFTSLEALASPDAWMWTTAGAAAAVAGNQVVSAGLRAAGRRELFPTAVLAVSVPLSAALVSALRWAEAPGSVLTLCMLWTLVLVNLSVSLLRRRPESDWAAPAGFLAAALLGAGLLGTAGYAVLAATALAYCVLQLVRFAPGTVRGYYLGAAQVLLTALCGLIAADRGIGIHGIFVAVSLSLAGQFALRIALRRRLAGIGAARVLDWGNLLSLAGVPLAYYLVCGTGAAAETATLLVAVAAAGAVGTQAVSAYALRGARGPETSRVLRETLAAALLALLLIIGIRAAGVPGSTLALAALWAAAGANAVTAYMHRRTRLALAAPAGLLAAAITGAGLLGLHGYQLLSAASLAYCLVLVRDRTLGFRGAYLAGAQVLAAVLAALLAAEAANPVDAFFIALAVSFAAAQILRTVFHRRIAPLGLAEPSRWGGLAVLTVLPVVYAAWPGRPAGGVLLVLVLTAATAGLFTQLAAAAGIRNGNPVPYAAALIWAPAGAVLAAELAVPVIEAPEGLWANVLVWAALAANTATALLLRPGRWDGIGAAGFAAAALAGAGLWELRGYEFLVLAGAAYGGFVATRRNQPDRESYVLAVQALAAVLAALLAADAGARVGGWLVVGASVLAATQVLRAALAARPAATGPGVSWQPGQWGIMAALAAAPFWYGGLAWVSGQGAQRDVTTVLLLLLLAVAGSGFVRWRSAALLYPAAYALAAVVLALTGLGAFSGRGLLPEAPLGIRAAGVLLTLLGMAALAGEARPALGLPVRAVMLTVAAVYPAITLVLAAGKGDLVLVAVGAAALAAVFLTASYTRSGAWLALGTALLLWGSAAAAVWEFQQTFLWAPLPPGYSGLWSAWTAAVVLQAVRLFLSIADRGPDAALRSRIMGSASAFVLVLGAVPAMAEWNGAAVAGSLTLMAALGLSVREAPAGLRETALQISVFPAALAVQRMGWFAIGTRVEPFWSVQFWAVILAGLAAWEFLRQRGTRGTPLLAGTAVLVSGSGLATVGYGGGAEQLWALIAHAGLLAFGLLAGRRLFTAWGAAGVALAVLWYLRGYTFLLLALLAAGLIALAIWRLARVRNEPDGVREKEESHS